MHPIQSTEAPGVLSNYLSEEVLDSVMAYQPDSISADQWNALRGFTLGLLPLLRPVSEDAFRKQMQPLLKFLMWTYTSGYTLKVESAFTAERVETWREVAFKEVSSKHSTVTETTVGDYVSRLRSMGRLINPDGGWPPVAGDIPGGVKRHLRAPYTDAEVVMLRQAVATMPAGLARDKAHVFLTVGLGFGPQPGEYRHLLTSHITVASDGIWVAIPGKRARLVPVANPHINDLVRLKAMQPDGPLIPVTDNPNSLSRTVKALRLGEKAPSLSPQRLRTTWMLDRLRAGVDPRPLFEWAGLATLNGLQDLLSYMPEAEVGPSVSAMRLAVRRSA